MCICECSVRPSCQAYGRGQRQGQGCDTTVAAPVELGIGAPDSSNGLIVSRSLPCTVRGHAFRSSSSNDHSVFAMPSPSMSAYAAPGLHSEPNETRTIDALGSCRSTIVFVTSVIVVGVEAGGRLQLLDGDDGQDALLADAEQPRQPPGRPPVQSRPSRLCRERAGEQFAQR